LVFWDVNFPLFLFFWGFCFWSWPGIGGFIEIVVDLVSVEEIYMLYEIYV